MPTPPRRARRSLLRGAAWTAPTALLHPLRPRAITERQTAEQPDPTQAAEPAQINRPVEGGQECARLG